MKAITRSGMTRLVLVGAVLLAFSFSRGANAKDVGIVCDRYASDDGEGGRRVVPIDPLTPDIAIEACEAPIQTHLQNSRHSLQLVRDYGKGRQSQKETEALHKISMQGNAVIADSEILRRESEMLELANEAPSPPTANPPIDELSELGDAYEGYVVVKACYEMSKSSLIQIVDDADLALAKTLIRKIEDRSSLSREKKDEAWKAASEHGRQLAGAIEMARTFGASTYTSDMNLVCRSTLAALKDAANLEPTTPKRDF